MKKVRYAIVSFLLLCGVFMVLALCRYKIKDNQKEKDMISQDTQVSTDITEQIFGQNNTETEKELEILNDTELDERERDDSETTEEQEQSVAEIEEEALLQDSDVLLDQNQNDSEESVREENSQPEQSDWVQSLRIAGQASQILVVSASGTQAEITLHNRNQNGDWYEQIRTSGFVGRDGVGQTSEYNQKSPAGIYNFSMAFGILPDPGSQITYTQVDESDYWVDDPSSQYYNQFVSTNAVQQDWNSAEHLISVAPAYDYALALNYNAACVPGNGSAIFLHVSTGRSTAGCISVPENIMISFLQNITPECVVIIANSSDLMNY